LIAFRAYIHTFMWILLAYQPWSRVILENLTVTQLFNKLHAFYGIPTVISTFTTERHCTLFRASSILTIFSHSFLKIHFNVIHHLRAYLPSYLLSTLQVFRLKLHAFLIFPVHATCPAQIILFDLNILIIFCEELKKWTATPPHMPLRSKYSYHPIPTKPLFVRTSLISNEKLNTVT
jgi:hypothetical protein